MGWLQTLGKRVALRVSAVVAKNELFERYGERPVQPPLQPGTWVAPSGEEESSDDDDKEPDCRAVTTEELLPTLKEGPRVIHHWATWCESCVEELPVLRELVGRTTVPVLGLSWDAFEGQGVQACVSDVREVARSHGLAIDNWVIDAEPDAFFAALDMEFRQVPQTWVVNGAGEIVHRVEGPVALEELDKVLEVVEALT